MLLVESSMSSNASFTKLQETQRYCVRAALLAVGAQQC